MDFALDSRRAATRGEFYDRLASRNLSPLWEVSRRLLSPEPVSKAKPFQWRYSEVRPFLMEAGRLVSAQEAQRRVLILENPAFTGESRATATLYAGIQLILPGETAIAHRHSASALRFVLEGEGAFTAVGGERTTMHAGDFVITPAWAVHDHGNEGTGPCVWMDGLDVPIVAFFEHAVIESHAGAQQALTRPEGDALARFGQGLLPMEGGSRYGLTTPIFNYPYGRTREALLQAARAEGPDPHVAVTLRYANPLDGGWTMPTIAAWMMYVPKGFRTAPMRSADGIVMAVAEGTGRVTSGDRTFAFAPCDVQVLPAWASRSIEAEEDAFLFLMSDRSALEKLGLYREERSA